MLAALPYPVFLLFPCIVLPLLTNWALAPLTEAAKERDINRQFTIADIFCLFVLAQTPMLLQSTVGLEGGLLEEGLIWWFWVIAAWAYGVRQMSRAGVQRTRTRASVLLLVLPATAIFPMIAMIFGQRVCLNEKDAWLSTVLFLIFLPGWAATVPFVVRRFLRQIVNEADVPRQP